MFVSAVIFLDRIKSFVVFIWLSYITFINYFG